MSLIKKRILDFISERGISKYQFYKETGITRGVLDGKSGISEDNLLKFVDRFPNVDLEWLIKGETSGISSNEIQESSSLKDEIIRLLVDDEDVKKAFKLFVGKEINSFASLKLLDLIKEEDFFKVVAQQINQSKEEEE